MDLDEILKQSEVKYPNDSQMLQQQVIELKRCLNIDEGQNQNTNMEKRQERFKCKYCMLYFSDRNKYRFHVKSHKSGHVCHICDRVFISKHHLDRHKRGHVHGYKTPTIRHCCDYCNETFQDYTSLFQHSNRLHSHKNINQYGGRDTSVDSAIEDYVNIHTIYPLNKEQYDILTFFTNIKHLIIQHLKRRCGKLKHMKWYLNIQVEVTRTSNIDEEEQADPYFRSRTFIMLSPEESDISHLLNEAYQKQFQSFDEYIRKGSGWTLKRCIKMEVHTIKYAPLSGSSYFPLPKFIRDKGAVINIKNNDNKCFLWSVLASLYPVQCHPERVKHYMRYEDMLKMENVQYPVPNCVRTFEKIEKLNNISINVLGYENQTIFPIYVSKIRNANHEVDLLYLKKGEQSHYCYIKKLNALLYHTKAKGNKYYFCRYCLQGMISRPVLSTHLEYCSTHECQRTFFPQKGINDTLEFTDFWKGDKIGFVIYADFETYCQRMDSCFPDNAKSSTTKMMRFEANSFGYKVVCVNERYSKPTVIYRGRDASKKFIECMIEEEKYINQIYDKAFPLNISNSEQERFEKTNVCHICNKPILEYEVKVRDHNHLFPSGLRGAAHRSCNLLYRKRRNVRILFHNLKNFDAHILCAAIGKFKEKDIKVVPNNMEKYVSFALGNLQFIDTYQFLNASLETIVGSLAEDGLKHFVNFGKEFTNEGDAHLLLRKNVYPYEFCDASSKFDCKTLPDRSAFYSSLTGSPVSKEDYDHAQKVWQAFDTKTFGEFHDLYLKTDVLLLCDCFERFRNMSIEYYKLDPCHFFTSPGLSWAAALRMTKVKLKLITDSTMYTFVEQAVRGGVSMISKRYAQANNEYVPETFDPSKKKNYIVYFDAVSLYSASMRESLPLGWLRFLSSDEIAELDLMNIPDDSPLGYLVQCDLEYPEVCHDAHSDYPLAPEHVLVTENMLSDYNKRLLLNVNIRGVETTKLIPTLGDKKKYILHHKALQLYTKLGLKLKAVYKVVEFRQSPWLKPYIDLNAEKRKQARDQFSKDFFKLMNNAVFGKTLENLRMRRNIALIHSKNKLRKHTAKTSFQRCQIFNEDLIGVEHKKVKLMLNRPIFVGQATLDLSKLIVYDFHYNEIKAKYGDKASLLFTDTDSLAYEIETDDVYKDMFERKHLYDLSNYDQNHFLYDKTNAKIPGKFKDELGGVPIKEFVGLKPKMYAYTYDSFEKHVAKGVAKATIRNDLTFDLYKECLFNQETKMCQMNLIQSKGHELGMYRINKVGLCPYDSKRYYLDGITSLPYFHYRITRNPMSVD